MKKFPKTFAKILMLTMLSALFSVTVASAAETYHGMTFNPPAGCWGGYDDEDDDFYYYSEDDDYTEISVYLEDWGINSVKDWPIQEWRREVNSWDGITGIKSASFETIGGYDFLKVVYEDEYDGKIWHNILYIGGPRAEYSMYYATIYTAMPKHQEFLSMINSVSFSGGSSGVNTPTNDVIKIYVNGSQVYPDADPVIINDRTLVPIRVIAEALGYNVSWDAPTKCVTMSRGNFDVQVMVDSTWITKYINGQVLEYGFMDVPAQIINDRTFIPVRAVTEAMGATVDWDGNTRSVYINGGNGVG